MAHFLRIKPEFQPIDPVTKEPVVEMELHLRGAEQFEYPLTEEQRDLFLVALGIKRGLVQKPLTNEEIAERGESG